MMPPRIDPEQVVSAALVEIDRAEAGARARCLGHPTATRNWVAAEIAAAVQARPRLGGLRLHGGRPARSYGRPASATVATVLWGLGEIRVSAARQPVGGVAWGEGPSADPLSRDEVLRALAPEPARERERRRLSRALRRLGLPAELPPGAWRLRRSWNTGPVAVLHRAEPCNWREAGAVVTPLGTWVGDSFPADRFSEVLEWLADHTGVPAERWREWLRRRPDPAVAEAELALGALARGPRR